MITTANTTTTSSLYTFNVAPPGGPHFQSYLATLVRYLCMIWFRFVFLLDQPLDSFGCQFSSPVNKGFLKLLLSLSVCHRSCRLFPKCCAIKL